MTANNFAQPAPRTGAGKTPAAGDCAAANTSFERWGMASLTPQAASPADSRIKSRGNPRKRLDASALRLRCSKTNCIVCAVVWTVRAASGVGAGRRKPTPPRAMQAYRAAALRRYRKARGRATLLAVGLSQRIRRVHWSKP